MDMFFMDMTEIPIEMEDETATSNIQFHKSGKIKQIEITQNQISADSNATDNSLKLTVKLAVALQNFCRCYNTSKKKTEIKN